MPLPYNKEHKERSRDLRTRITIAEQKLWKKLRRKQILGLQFYRQKPIHQFIVDFYCSQAALVIEVDGGQHWESGHAAADNERDVTLEQMGLRVLRFSNREVLTQLGAVVEQIYEVAKERSGIQS